MNKKKTIIFNLVFLVLALSFVAYLMYNYLGEGPAPNESDCLDVNHVTSFIYDSCYDAYDKNIYLQVKREKQDGYSLNSIKFSFFDFSDQEVTVYDVPLIGQMRNYKFPSKKNPENLDVRLDIVHDFVAPVCEEPRSVFVKYCPSRESNLIEAQFNPLGVEESKFVDVNSLDESFGGGLSSADENNIRNIFNNICPEPSCSEWGYCHLSSFGEWIETRNCDSSGADASATSGCYSIKPLENRLCSNPCEFEVVWDKCTQGYTNPSFVNDGGCATLDNLPKPIACSPSKDKCVPDIREKHRSSCAIDYELVDLNYNAIRNFKGVESVDYVDVNGCTGNSVISVKEECSLNVDIYTSRFEKCGKSYVAIIDSLTGNKLAEFVDTGNGLDIMLGGDSGASCTVG